MITKSLHTTLYIFFIIKLKTLTPLWIFCFLFHLTTQPCMTINTRLEIKEDLFSWEHVYPDLVPQLVLETLMALWNYEAELSYPDKGDPLKHGGGRCAKILKHPMGPPPPPPCQLDGVEYELEITRVLDNTRVMMPDRQRTESDLIGGQHSNSNATRTYPFPDLVPESFDNIQLQRGQVRIENGKSLRKCGHISNIHETMFLTFVLLSSLLLLYLLPAFTS